MTYDFIYSRLLIVKKISKLLNNDVPVVCMMIDCEGDYKITYNVNGKHAEMIMLDTYNCRNAVVFLNLEPCPMCLHALSMAKVKYLFFSIYNKKYGACGGKFHLKQHIDYSVLFYYGGFNIKENEDIFKEYFKKLRK